MADEQQSWIGAMASWGYGMYNYAASTVSSIMGYEDLDVVNPESAGAEHEKENENDQRQQEFSSFRDYIGTDITSLVVLPVWIMQPFTILQNCAEIMEYTDIIDKAVAVEDEYERFAWVVGFFMGPFGTVERTWKPFNPILGETFELECNNGVRFIAEQVSHHPPISAAHAENPNFVYDIVAAPKTKFLGNSVEVYPNGRSRLKLKKTGEEFSLVPPINRAYNVIVGKTWVDTFGDFHMLNNSTGAKCHLVFKPCGWFSAGHYEIAGHIKTADGTPVIALSGKWNSYLDMQKCDGDGEALPDAEKVRLWTCKDKPKDDKYGFTHWARKLMTSEGCANPLPSDSRRRPDRAALEDNETVMSGKYKYELEEMQRAEKKERTAKGLTWTPRWFKPAPDQEILPGELPEEVVPLFEFTGDYYQAAKRPVAEAEHVKGKAFCPWQFPEMHRQVNLYE